MLRDPELSPLAAYHLSQALHRQEGPHHVLPSQVVLQPPRHQYAVCGHATIWLHYLWLSLAKNMDGRLVPFIHRFLFRNFIINYFFSSHYSLFRNNALWFYWKQVQVAEGRRQNEKKVGKIPKGGGEKKSKCQFWNFKNPGDLNFSKLS